jgi:D-threo-aldose 1-dehydrogenase
VHDPDEYLIANGYDDILEGYEALHDLRSHGQVRSIGVGAKELSNKGVYIINSAVFHAGFLTGGAYYDYKLMDPANDAHKAIFRWREQFFEICQAWQVQPAEACVQFALSAPGVGSIALNTTSPSRVKKNVAMAQAVIPPPFWETLRMKGLISASYSYI